MAATEITNDDALLAATAPKGSSLLEFPGSSRASRPQWRKDLSARVREIQERRAREAEEVPHERVEESPATEIPVPQLGLVPTPDAPEVNPIVAAALKRLERAHQSPPRSRHRASMGGAAAAMAHVAEEQYESEAQPVQAQASVPAPLAVPLQSAKAEVSQQPKTSEPAREHQLAVVPAQLPLKVTAPPASKPQPKRVSADVVDKAPPIIAHQETSRVTPAEEFYDDHAPVVPRVVGSLLDILVVAFASSPFAAIIELTNGNWEDWRVIASMCGIFLVVMFLYLAASTALAGRTFGMSLVSLRAVDADTGLPPTTKQSVGRAVLYIVSLITLGLGILYSLFDAEGRAAHDHLSGTAVVRE